jgi:hypothetical protein
LGHAAASGGWRVGAWWYANVVRPFSSRVIAQSMPQKPRGHWQVPSAQMPRLVQLLKHMMLCSENGSCTVTSHASPRYPRRQKHSAAPPRSATR